MKNLIVSIACLTSIVVFATEGGAISAKSAEKANADLSIRVNAKSLLKEAFNQFAEEAGISYGGVTPDGRIYSKGQSAVNADYSSPQFIKSRAMAYERAYLSAVSQFMIDFYGRTTTDKIAEYYGIIRATRRILLLQRPRELARK